MKPTTRTTRLLLVWISRFLFTRADCMRWLGIINFFRLCRTSICINSYRCWSRKCWPLCSATWIASWLKRGTKNCIRLKYKYPNRISWAHWAFWKISSPWRWRIFSLKACMLSTEKPSRCPCSTFWRCSTRRVWRPTAKLAKNVRLSSSTS